MSERMHSTPPAAPRGRWFSILTGTALLVVCAGIAFQVFRAQSAKSQTREPGSSDAPGTATVGGAEQSGQAVARVNNQAITWDMVAKEAYERHKYEVLDNLINRMMIQQECEKRGVVVSNDEIRQEVHSIAKKFNLPTDTWYQMLASERQITPEQYHRDVIWPMLALKKLAGTNIQVTEDDLRKAFIRDYGPRVEARMITIDGNLKRAIDLAQKAQADPENFDRLAREFSADANTRALGGSIPPIRMYGARSEDEQKIEQTAFHLQPGEVSSVIQLDATRHVVLKCERITDPVVTDINEVREALESQLIEEKTQEAVASVFKDIKERAQIHNYLTNESTGGSPYATRTGTGAPAQPAPSQTAAPQPGARTTIQ